MQRMSPTVGSPDDPLLDELCRALAARTDALDASGCWPAEQLGLCRRAGVWGWFVPRIWGGQEWSEVDLLRGYAKLGAACLSTAFVLTQPHGVARRIADGENVWLKERVLPELATGEAFASVGISHLTTSRRHLTRPSMAAEVTPEGFLLDGLCPWVTGGAQARYIVTGASLDDGRQILVVLPTELDGVLADEPAQMVGLTSTQTGAVRCQRVGLGREWLLAGPMENVVAGQRGAKTGGLQTSALALGLASAAIEYLEREASPRSELRAAASSLRDEHAALDADLMCVARGNSSCSNDELRARANSLALRASHAGLAAAKGSGYIQGHPAGRWCREALFFLVWSCPQPVMQAALCEFAGLE